MKGEAGAVSAYKQHVGRTGDTVSMTVNYYYKDNAESISPCVLCYYTYESV